MNWRELMGLSIRQEDPQYPQITNFEDIEDVSKVFQKCSGPIRVRPG
jgi:hypothetical protein